MTRSLTVGGVDLTGSAEQYELLTPSLTPGEALRDMGMRQITDASDPSDVERVDTVIRQWAARHVNFSANDIRPELHGVRPNLIGARFRYLAEQGVIVMTGERVRSTLPSTRGHRIDIWTGAL